MSPKPGPSATASPMARPSFRSCSMRPGRPEAAWSRCRPVSSASGHLVIPANVTLQGIYRVPPTTGPRAITNLTGSVLLAYEGRGRTNGPPFIRLAGNNSASPAWSSPTRNGSRPTCRRCPIRRACCRRTPRTSACATACCSIPTKASSWSAPHRHLVRNVTGYPIKRGIYVDECYDIGHIENVHFWPFGVSYDPNNPYCKWVNTEGVAFELARTDWHYVFNTFCFGYGVGYKFSSPPTAAPTATSSGSGPIPASGRWWWSRRSRPACSSPTASLWAAGAAPTRSAWRSARASKAR